MVMKRKRDFRPARRSFRSVVCQLRLYRCRRARFHQAYRYLWRGPRRDWLKHYPWIFRSKLQLGVGLVRWLTVWLTGLSKPLWLAVDGAYA